MDKYEVLVGEIGLDDDDPKITIYAESETPIARISVAHLKDKLYIILSQRFVAAPPARSKQRKVPGAATNSYWQPLFRFGMDKRSVLIGEIVLGSEPRIALYAENPVPLSNAGVAVLKDKLAFILDTRFRPSNPIPTDQYIRMAEVIKNWRCSPAKIAELVRCERLHPIVMNDEAFFNPDEIARVLTFR